MTTDLLPRQAVRLGLPSTDRFSAVKQAGELLVEIGAVEVGYVDAMRQREEMMSSFVGEGFAIPHGTDEGRAMVKRASLAFLQYPEGLDWDGQTVYACVAIAATADEHVGVMSNLAQILMNAEQAELLRTTTDPDVVLQLMTAT